MSKIECSLVTPSFFKERARARHVKSIGLLSNKGLLSAYILNQSKEKSPRS
jgi:hypothetical protein